MTTTLAAAVRRALAGGGAFPGVVVAVSGGPDSVALLYAVLAARGEETASVIVAHLNHGLRGPESDADEQFVRDLHRELTEGGAAGLGLACAGRDLRAEAGGANLEATARRVRYRWLAEVARAHGVGRVATGHTASDQAETVLHHILRGTGLAGLRGIAAARELEAGVEVVRPLLRVSRAEVLGYLVTLKQGYRVDRSNDDRRLTRNRLRCDTLPLLREQYNPRLDEALARLAEQADEVCRAEHERARELLAAAELPRAGDAVILDAPALAAAPDRLACGVLRLVWAREGWPAGRMGYDDWRRLARLARAEAGAVDLPGGIHARRRGRAFQLGRVGHA